MLSEPHGKLGCLVGEVIDFNAVEMVEADAGNGQLIELLQDLHLQPAQLLVGDDEEVAAAACRVEDVKVVDAVQQLSQAGVAALGLVEFLMKLIEKQGPMTFMMLGTDV